jgi:AraC-like DNA-binding protein
MPRLAPYFARLSGLGPLPRLFADEVGGRTLHGLLASEGLYLDGMAPNAPVPFASMNEVFNRAAWLNADALFSLRVARAMRPEDYGPLVSFALQGRTLATGIRRLCRLGPLQNNATRFGLTRAGGSATWSLHYIAARGLRVDHHALHVLVPMIDFVRRYAGTAARPVTLHVTASAGAFRRSLESALEIPVTGGAASFGLTFPAEWLNLPLPVGTSGPAMTFAEMIAGYRTETLPNSITDTVAALLLPIIGNADIDLDLVASRLNLSRRGLQQKLNDEGSSFRDIALRVRVKRAKDRMMGGGDTLAQVALAVGYSDQAHFHRAFKSATGVTPQEFRRQTLGDRLIAAE